MQKYSHIPLCPEMIIQHGDQKGRQLSLYFIEQAEDKPTHHSQIWTNPKSTNCLL